MPENRFFLEGFFSDGQKLTITDEEFRHLKVMRGKIGDIIELVNGENQLARGAILHMGRSHADVSIVETLFKQPPKKQIILAQPYLKPKNLELVIEKGTELGATAFWLFPSEKSEKKELSSKQLKRMKQITISALKQCGRLDLPEILQLPPLAEWKIPQGDLYFGDINGTFSISHSELDTIVFIGPESGFSFEEDHLLRHRFKAKGLKLSNNILRAETAAICALSLISY